MLKFRKKSERAPRVNELDELLRSQPARHRGRCNWCGNEGAHMPTCPVYYKLHGHEWPPPGPTLRERVARYLRRLWASVVGNDDPR